MGIWDRIKQNNKNALRDNVAGTWNSIKNGTSGDPSATRAEVRAAREEREQKGGWLAPDHGFIEGRPVTFALGWGSRDGETLLADGHLSEKQFRDSSDHDHYGRGDGPNNNGTLRQKYTGPGA